MEKRAIPHLVGMFHDSIQNRRKLALTLYALVAPPFALTSYLLASTHKGSQLATLAVLGTCLVAFTFMVIRREPKATDWIFPAIRLVNHRPSVSAWG